MNCWQAVFHLDAGWPVGSAGRPVNLLPNLYASSEHPAPNLSLPKASMGDAFTSSDGAWWLPLTGLSLTPAFSTCSTWFHEPLHRHLPHT